MEEVLALVQQGKIRHSIGRIRFEGINENLEMVRCGDIIGAQQLYSRQGGFL
jgi:hypothetical protein